MTKVTEAMVREALKMVADEATDGDPTAAIAKATEGLMSFLAKEASNAPTTAEGTTASAGARGTQGSGTVEGEGRRQATVEKRRRVRRRR